MKFIILALILAMSTVHVTAAPLDREALEAHITRELSCWRKPPNPTPTLVALVQSKLINLSEQKGYDSISCWNLKGRFSVNGMPVVGVCAYEEDELIRALHPGYYWRGPGTSPGVQLALISSWPVAKVKAWAQSALSPTGKYRVETSDGVIKGTEVSCHESDFPLPDD